MNQFIVQTKGVNRFKRPSRTMAVDLSVKGTAALLDFTKEIALEGGNIIKEAFSKPQQADYGRKTATDPVTETDKAV